MKVRNKSINFALARMRLFVWRDNIPMPGGREVGLGEPTDSQKLNWMMFVESFKGKKRRTRKARKDERMRQASAG
jgi:hypothetical protein